MGVSRQGVMTGTFEAFRLVLSRYFLADQVSLGDERVLYETWRDYSASPVHIMQLYQLVALEWQWNFHGYLWWESRHAGQGRNMIRIGYEERILLFLCGYPVNRESLHCPVVRPYCPDDLVGQWRITAVRQPLDTATDSVLCKADRLIFCADGMVHVVSGSSGSTGEWRVHRCTREEYELLFQKKDPGHPERWKILRDGEKGNVYLANGNWLARLSRVG